MESGAHATRPTVATTIGTVAQMASDAPWALARRASDTIFRKTVPRAPQTAAE